MQPPPRQPLAIVEDLRRLGVMAGDLLFVHASLRAIGSVADGATGLIEALRQSVRPDGTLLMVLGARDDWAWVNRRPEADRPALLRDAEPFDYVVTSADPDVGVLAEVFRKYPARVSNHPEGRFAAIGKLAEELTTEVPWDDYYGPGSPLERFVNHNGRVLRLGADPDTVTLIHYAEYLTAVPNKRRDRRHRLVSSPSGPEVRIVECLDDSKGIVEHPGEDYFITILNEYLATGRASRGTVGNAPSELIEGADIVGFASDWMAEHLGR